MRCHHVEVNDGSENGARTITSLLADMSRQAVVCTTSPIVHARPPSTSGSCFIPSESLLGGLGRLKMHMSAACEVSLR